MYRSLMALVAVVAFIEAALRRASYALGNVAVSAEDKAVEGLALKADAVLEKAEQRLAQARLEVARAGSFLDDEVKRHGAKIEAIIEKHGYVI